MPSVGAGRPCRRVRKALEHSLLRVGLWSARSTLPSWWACPLAPATGVLRPRSGMWRSIPPTRAGLGKELDWAFVLGSAAQMEVGAVTLLR